MYNIMIIDDHAIVRHGLKALIESNSNLHVIAQAASVKEALSFPTYEQIDLILLDYQLEDGTGLDIAKYVKSSNSTVKIILLTAFLNIEKSMYIDAYLLKNIDSTLILDTIHQLLHYEQSIIDLTPLEQEIMNALTQGFSNKEIAASLFISEKTVRNYLTTIFKKLNVTNRTEAALFWNNYPKHHST